MHTRLTASSSLLSHMQRGRRGAARRIQVKLEGNAPSRAEKKKKLKRRGGGVGGVLACVNVRERERECVWREMWGGGGGGVRPAAVAMATTSRCCRSSGSQREERVSLKLRGEEERREQRSPLHTHTLPAISKASGSPVHCG